MSSSALDPVVVTATRNPQRLQTAPIGASIITADEIERSGVADANEAIRKLGGVASRTDLMNGREHSLDLRGYGATADNNLVVLVDGIRLSANEQRSARLSAIPLDQIERIEIIRGGASVSWGEGASAGVINVILKNGQVSQPTAKLSASVESYDGRDLQGSASLPLGQHATLESSLRRLSTDGYRDNSEYDQMTGSVGLRWADAGWRAKLNVNREEQDVRLPSSLTFDQFKQNPRQASTPLDFGWVRETGYTASLGHEIGQWSVSVDLGQRDLSVYYFSESSFGIYEQSKESSQRQLSPRVTYAAQWSGGSFSSTWGLDWQTWDFDADGTDGPENGRRFNRAKYWRADLSLPSQTRLSGGLRWEHISQKSEAASVWNGNSEYERHDSLKASELAVSQTIRDGLDIYGRVASSYRLPNIDDNRGLPEPLLPQKNRDREVGLKWAQPSHSLTVRWFRQVSTNEIALIPGLFFPVNANMDPTRRQGYELAGNWRVTPLLELSATWQELTAKYRKGVNAGKEQVLVAPRTATARASYRMNDHHSIDVGLQYLAATRFGDDYDNQCARRIPESTLLDARYAWTDRVWTVAVSGTNLTDRSIYKLGFRCASGAVYPEPGRALKFTVSRQF